MPINNKRKAGMQKKSEKDLLDIVKSGSLSASAAEYELKQRGFHKNMTAEERREKYAKEDQVSTNETV